MAAYLKSLADMMAVWNSTDAAEQRSLVESALEHNVHFADPNHNIVGREAFLKMVAQVQSQIPGAVYARASEIGMQNNFCRYHWTIHLNRKLVMPGFDMTEVNDAGKIVRVIGFFGELDRSLSNA
ncbi:MAG: nuclear transport factor 2 family protein [Parvularculaceae bacterium]|nr:nuclear transport factor 2 family protein [Parvularculaceae bacterium]